MKDQHLYIDKFVIVPKDQTASSVSEDLFESTVGGPTLYDTREKAEEVLALRKNDALSDVKEPYRDAIKSVRSNECVKRISVRVELSAE